VENPNLKKLILSFKFPASTEINKMIPELEKCIINAPWVAVSQAPQVQCIKFENNEHIVEVGVFTLKKEYADSIRKIVVKNLSVVP
jgi:hypothetical protein